MNAKRIVYQRPSPKIVIKDPETGNTVKSKNSGMELVFSNNELRNLLSYSFTLSVNDISGSFSAILYPDYRDSLGNEYSLFDDFEKLQIVDIYEGNGTSQDKPVFTGIIRTKKYTAQNSDSGGTRRISISGTAITGLVSQFYINLDVSACALTKEFRTQADLIKKLTIDGETDESVKSVIKKVWDCFYSISQQTGTPKIKEYIDRFTGGTDKLFDVDDSVFHYPLGCIFRGQTTQDFFSLIDEIVPSPVYEKFAYMDSESGLMRIKIRTVPFSNSDWAKLIGHETFIQTYLLQNFDLTESDEEVYTAFYAYLNGYPVDEQKSLILSILKSEGVDTVLKDSERFKTYGYRPLIAHFIGYGTKDGENDSKTASNMEQVSENLKSWYENLPDMLKGSLTLSMAFDGETATNRIQPGEAVKFLSGNFYVEGVTHNWNYGSGGEINLSVSRGASYMLDGSFRGKIKDLTKLTRLLFRAADAQSINRVGI